MVRILHKVISLMSALLVAIALLLGTIYLYNNSIASEVLAELTRIPLPINCKQLESAAVPGKMFGNGNGMQYIGAILFSSDMQMEAIESHFIAYNPNIFVMEFKNASQTLGNVFKNQYTPETLQNAYIAVLCASQENGMISSDIIGSILNCDPRGH